MKKHCLGATAALALLAGQGMAAPDLNLGLLGPGSHAFSGTTVGADNTIDTYAPISNSAAIWDQDFIYEFSLAGPAVLSLDTNDPDSSPDNDFYLLNSLATTINANGLREAITIQPDQVYVDGPLGVHGAGTYYLVIDAWRGNPNVSGTPATGRAGAFSGQLIIEDIVAPSNYIDLGALASENSPFSLDTVGSDFDTELGLFDELGSLLASNDDVVIGDPTSQIDLLSGLAEGEYYVALGGYNTAFADGFSVDAGDDYGTYALNHPAGTSSGTLAEGSVQWFRFTVTPEPSSLALVALAGGCLLRRRGR